MTTMVLLWEGFAFKQSKRFGGILTYFVKFDLLLIHLTNKDMLYLLQAVQHVFVVQHDRNVCTSVQVFLSLNIHTSETQL